MLAVFVLALIAYLGSVLGAQWLFGIAIPYLAVIIFVIGFVMRVMGWAKSAVPIPDSNHMRSAKILAVD